MILASSAAVSASSCGLWVSAAFFLLIPSWKRAVLRVVSRPASGTVIISGPVGTGAGDGAGGGVWQPETNDSRKRIKAMHSSLNLSRLLFLPGLSFH